MKHESIETSIITEEVSTTFDEIYRKPWFPKNEVHNIEKANLLILPNYYDSEEKEVFFPETTNEFFDYIQKSNSEDDLICDIAISEENYYKIEKHSALIDIATVLVTSGLLPVAINMISSFLYDLVKKHRRAPKETSAKVTILAEQTKNKKTIKINYEGPVEGIKEALNDTIAGYFKE